MFESIFKRRHAKLLAEDVDEVLSGHEADINRQLTHIDVGTLEQDAGMFQSHVSDKLGRCLARQVAHAVEEWYAT